MTNINPMQKDFSEFSTFFFDLDGTLIDTSLLHAQAIRETLKKNDPVVHLLNRFKNDDVLGIGSYEVFRNLGIEDNELIESLVYEKRLTYEECIESGNIRLFNKVLELLELLRSFNRKVYIVTSSSKKTATKVLQKSKLCEYFDNSEIITSDDCKERKSKGDLFKFALDRFNEKTNDVLVVEDAQSAYEDSIKEGISAIIVNQANPVSQSHIFDSFELFYDKIFNDLFKDRYNDYKPCAMDKGTKDELYCQDIDILHDIVSDDEINVIYEQLKDQLKKYDNETFNDKLKDYNPKSDKELLYLLTLARKLQSPLYLYRIAGPLLIRLLLENYLENQRRWNFTMAELFGYIPSLNVLLPNPDKTEFLHRMDCENVGSWGIWRIRQEILLFAKALLKFEKLFEGKNVKVGFHENQVVWNFGTVANIITLVRSYNHGTGHDGKVETNWLYFHDKTLLAESFLNFWHVTNRQHTTKQLQFQQIEDQIKSFPKWPGLFKGNANLVYETDLDKEEPEHFEIENKDYILKICRSQKENFYEQNFLKSVSKPEVVNSFYTFKPVKIVKIKKDFKRLSKDDFEHQAIPKDYFEHQAIPIERIKGVSLDDIISSIYSEANKCHSERSNASVVLGVFIKRAIKALYEFQKHAKKIHKGELIPYPYDKKLGNALEEVQGIIESSKDFDKIVGDAEKLGKELNQFVINEEKVFPFRDAHLKNSLWISEETAETLARNLLKKDIYELDQEAKKQIKDIDFETSGYKVTRWEDPIHILFFELSGIDPTIEENKPKTYLNYTRYYEKWHETTVRSERGFWCTILARSIREYCRRLWYMKTLPNNYKKRYKNENITYFIHLGILAIIELENLFKDEDNFPKLKEFLSIQLDNSKHFTKERLKRPLYPTYIKKRCRNKVNILHLSDLHFEINDKTIYKHSPDTLLRNLLNDIRCGNYNDENHKDNDNCCYIDYLVISGDFIAAERDFEVRGKKFRIAEQFIHNLMIELDTWEDRCIIVPGNHDVYITEHGEDYNQFETFYRKIKNSKYDEHYQNRALFVKNDSTIEFICLNSCYQENRDIEASGFHPNAFKSIGPKKDSSIRIAVLHHPLECIEKHTNEDIKNSISQFKDNEIELILHGHSHKLCRRTTNDTYSVYGVGSFGAIHKRLPEGTPRYYNLLCIDTIDRNDENASVVHHRQQTNVKNGWENLHQGKEPIRFNKNHTEKSV